MHDLLPTGQQMRGWGAAHRCAEGKCACPVPAVANMYKHSVFDAVGSHVQAQGVTLAQLHFSEDQRHKAMHRERQLTRQTGVEPQQSTCVLMKLRCQVALAVIGSAWLRAAPTQARSTTSKGYGPPLKADSSN